MSSQVSHHQFFILITFEIMISCHILFLFLSVSFPLYLSLSLCQFLLPICIIISTLKCLHDVFCNFFEKHVAWKCVESIMQICHHHLIWEKNKWKHNEYYLETFILNEGRLFLNICRAINNVILTVLPTCSSNVFRILTLKTMI